MVPKFKRKIKTKMKSSYKISVCLYLIKKATRKVKLKASNRRLRTMPIFIHSDDHSVTSYITMIYIII